ncbi:MAG: ABC transporter ATP-binding protein [Burkholderiaceae bacterium]|nr:ABC transporter ATP-binding protein [Microbacteriaceae bacterium]
MTLSLRLRVDTRDVDLDLQVAAGETVAILGPNGAGKSTLLEAAAGLVRPDAGRAELDGRVLFALGSGEPDRWLPPHERGISLLAQEALLFPHLSVLDNVAFGPRSAGASTREARRRAAEWLAEVDGSEFADRRPGGLSGGEAQRIAVARALASEPRLLLLDEPLASLDVSVAPALRRMLRRVLAGRSAILVTHDALDAYTLADRVVVIEGGRIVEQGATRQVLERPRSAFAARIAGLNVLAGSRTADGLRLPDGTGITIGDPAPAPLGAPVIAAIRPLAVTVDTAPAGRATDAPVGRTTGLTARLDNTIRGTVHDLEPRGDVIRVSSGLLSADISPAVAADLDLAVGDTVWFRFDGADAVLYPAGTGSGHQK